MAGFTFISSNHKEKSSKTIAIYIYSPLQTDYSFTELLSIYTLYSAWRMMLFKLGMVDVFPLGTDRGSIVFMVSSHVKVVKSWSEYSVSGETPLPHLHSCDLHDRHIDGWQMRFQLLKFKVRVRVKTKVHKRECVLFRFWEFRLELCSLKWNYNQWSEP
jgi:hypothetical protein